MKRINISVLRPMLVVPLALLLCFLSCQSRPAIISPTELDSLTKRAGLGHLYYSGSDLEYHYFATKYFLEPTRYYRTLKSDYSIQKEFPKTSDHKRWSPYLRDLNTKTQGFE